MARFAGSARGKSYEFEQNRLFGPTETRDSFTGESAALGSLVPGMYNQVAKSGWDPASSLQQSIANRANEKVSAIGAEANVRMSQMNAEATVEAAKLQAKYADRAAEKQASGAMVGSVFSAVGSIGAALISDETTKDDIRPLHYALEKLRELRPVTFHYNEEYSSSPERLHHGFIAQDFQQVLPDATYFDESTEKLCIDPGDVIAILVRAVQELEGRVSRMEATQYLAGARR